MINSPFVCIENHLCLEPSRMQKVLSLLRHFNRSLLFIYQYLTCQVCEVLSDCQLYQGCLPCSKKIHFYNTKYDQGSEKPSFDLFSKSTTFEWSLNILHKHLIRLQNFPVNLKGLIGIILSFLALRHSKSKAIVQ